MKIYVLDENGRYAENDNRQKLYTEITPCSDCGKYGWTEEEHTVIKQAIELVSLLANFRRDRWQVTEGQASSSDLRDVGRLRALYDLPREPFDYDSDELGDLKYVLYLAAFSGVSDIPVD